MELMRNVTVLLGEIEQFLELNLKSDSANHSELLSTRIIKDIVKLNNSAVTGDIFEDIQDTLWDANQLLEEMGYTQSYTVKLW